MATTNDDDGGVVVAGGLTGDEAIAVIPPSTPEIAVESRGSSDAEAVAAAARSSPTRTGTGGEEGVGAGAGAGGAPQAGYRGWVFRLRARGGGGDENESAAEIWGGGCGEGGRRTWKAPSPSGPGPPPDGPPEGRRSARVGPDDVEDDSDGEDDNECDGEGMARLLRSADPLDRRAGRARGRPGPSWTYSSSAASDWSLTSRIILAVTYRPLVHAVPEHTALSPPRDYLHRCLTCRARGHSRGCGNGGERGGRRRPCGCLGPKNVLMRRETYTADDVVRAEVLPEEGEGVSVRAFSGARCRAVRVHLRPKTGGRRERFGDGGAVGEVNASESAREGARKRLERAGRGRQPTNGDAGSSSGGECLAQAAGVGPGPLGKEDTLPPPSVVPGVFGSC